MYDILEDLAGGMTEAEILAACSKLTSEDIKACLAFAAKRYLLLLEREECWEL
ncbi:MAG: DUF433 domain-containing protein [Stenomitos frigidus ULC029]